MTERLFDYWLLGIIWSLGFGDWNFDPSCVLAAKCFDGLRIDKVEDLHKGLVATLSGSLSFSRNAPIDFRIRSGMATGV
jgi:hypothetical protein